MSKLSRTIATAALDAEREASMADEGGVSAALLEIEDPKERKARQPGVARHRGIWRWMLGGIVSVAAVAALGWFRRA